MLKAAAIFLLTSPPLEELTDEIAHVAEKFRMRMLSKSQALDQLIEKHKDYLENYINDNLVLNGLK